MAMITLASHYDSILKDLNATILSFPNTDQQTIALLSGIAIQMAKDLWMINSFLR